MDAVLGRGAPAGIFVFHAARVQAGVGHLVEVLFQFVQVRVQGRNRLDGFLSEVVFQRCGLFCFRQLLQGLHKVGDGALGVGLHTVGQGGGVNAQLFQDLALFFGGSATRRHRRDHLCYAGGSYVLAHAHAGHSVTYGGNLRGTQAANVAQAAYGCNDAG